MIFAINEIMKNSKLNLIIWTIVLPFLRNCTLSVEEKITEISERTDRAAIRAESTKYLGLDTGTTDTDTTNFESLLAKWTETRNIDEGDDILLLFKLRSNGYVVVRKGPKIRFSRYGVEMWVIFDKSMESILSELKDGTRQKVIDTLDGIMCAILTDTVSRAIGQPIKIEPNNDGIIDLNNNGIIHLINIL